MHLDYWYLCLWPLVFSMVCCGSTLKYVKYVQFWNRYRMVKKKSEMSSLVTLKWDDLILLGATLPLGYELYLWPNFMKNLAHHGNCILKSSISLLLFSTYILNIPPSLDECNNCYQGIRKPDFKFKGSVVVVNLCLIN